MKKVVLKIGFLGLFIVYSLTGWSQLYNCCFLPSTNHQESQDSINKLIRVSAQLRVTQKENDDEFVMISPIDYEAAVMARNYFYAELIEPLLAGKKYSITVVIKKRESQAGMPIIPGYGLSFGQEKFSQDTSYRFGQIVPLEIEKIDSNWSEISVTYQAMGNEKYMVIGLLPYSEYWSEFDNYGLAMKAVNRYDRSVFAWVKQRQVRKMRKSLFGFEGAYQLSDEKVIEITRAIKISIPKSVNAFIGLKQVEIKPL